MKIRLTDIPRHGLQVNTAICLAGLNARMSEGTSNDIEFLSAPQVALEVRLERGSAESGAVLDGTVSTQYRQPCPHCLRPISRKLEEKIDFILKPRPAGKFRPEEADDQPGLIYFEGEHIDLEDILQETLILAISPFGFHHEDCEGFPAPPKSGESKKTVPFSNLLKKAGIE